MSLLSPSLFSAAFCRDTRIKEVKRGRLFRWLFGGTLPRGQINEIISAINRENKSYKIEYIEIPPSSYENEVVNALASGKGPDFWLISQDMVLKNKDKISPIPFIYYPERDFRDNFADISNLFIDQKNGGLTAFPF